MKKAPDRSGAVVYFGWMCAKSGGSGTHLLPEDNPRERQRWLAGQLPSSATNAAVVRFLGTQLLRVRIDLDD